LREIGHDRRQLVLAQEILDDYEIERIAAERCRAQTVEFEHDQLTSSIECKELGVALAEGNPRRRHAACKDSGALSCPDWR
jgi:hypothetical protein